MKKCPYCGKKYFDDVVRCALDQSVLVACDPAEVPSAPEKMVVETGGERLVKTNSGMKALGWILIVVGIGGTLYFTFGFSTTLPESNVVNLDLQQDRLFGFLDSQVNFLAGLLILLFKSGQP